MTTSQRFILDNQNRYHNAAINWKYRRVYAPLDDLPPTMMAIENCEVKHF